jgi:hypothetical protein
VAFVSKYQQQFTGSSLVVGSLRVYRAWEPYVPLVGQRGVEWDTPAMDAKCILSGCGCDECMKDSAKPHKAIVPKKKCTCGIYGFYTPEFVDAPPIAVLGTIRATGKLLMGTTGVRAAHAEIESLLLTAKQDHWGVTRKDLKVKYPEVPVYKSTEKWLADYPPESVSELLDG